MTSMDLIQFVYSRGNRHLFKDWTLGQVIAYFNQHAEDGDLYIINDVNGIMIGFLGLHPFPKEKVLLVDGVFATDMVAYMDALMKIYQDKYMGWTVESEKRGIKYVRNPATMLRMIEKIKRLTYGKLSTDNANGSRPVPSGDGESNSSPGPREREQQSASAVS